MGIHNDSLISKLSATYLQEFPSQESYSIVQEIPGGSNKFYFHIYLHDEST